MEKYNKLDINPYNLISMREFYATHFTKLFDSLNSNNPLTFIIGGLNHIMEQCEYLSLTVSHKKVSEIIDSYQFHKITKTPFPSQSDIEQLKFTILAELESNLFLHVSRERAKYYNNYKIWSSITKKMPLLGPFLVEAGNCFALARYTGCVMILTRLLENPLKNFGKELGINVETLDLNSWGQILVKIENAVNNLKKEDQNKEYYSRLTSYFFVLKNGWRNCTFHGNSTYNEEEAYLILNNFKAFLEKFIEKFYDN